MWGALFPGQGSQSVGMGRFLCDEFKSARELFEHASDTLSLDLKKLCFDGAETELLLTENTQPALLLVSTAGFQVLRETVGFKPKIAAGHSVGEYAALIAAGVLSFEDALRAVRRRGQEMQRAVPVGTGAMCAVLGLEDGVVTAMCRAIQIAAAEELGGTLPLEPANFNSPGQVVVSGAAQAIAWMRSSVTADWLSEHRVGVAGSRPKFIPLTVSAPFHCSMMKPAEDAMAEVLSAVRFAIPQFDVVQNFTASISSDPSEIRSRLVQQISGAVRWSQCQMTMIRSGVVRYIECGNGKVLAGLAKKIAAQQPGVSVQVFGLNSIEDIKQIEAQFNEGGA